MKKTAKQVVDLLKNIVLRNPPKDSRKYQFMAGRRKPFTFAGGIGFTWWITPRGSKAIEAIASMMIDFEPEFSGCDHESVEKAISTALQEMSCDRPLFKADDIMFGRCDSLLDCRGVADINVFSSQVLELIRMKVREELSKRCVIYVAPRLTGATFRVLTEGLSVIARTDTEIWQKWVSSEYATGGFDIETATFKDDKSFFPFANAKYDYLFVVENEGTLDHSKFNAQIVLRRFFAVCFSFLARTQRGHFHKVMASPLTQCLQFQDISSKAPSMRQSDIGDLLPYYMSDSVIDEKVVSLLQGWYADVANLDDEGRNRSNSAAHFVNRGMNGGDIERYINYFIALDALFGRRGSVEASIVSGVKSLTGADSWSEKVPKLFDLRNELVHGGCRHVKEWRSYRSYYQHFDSRPENDIERLAFHALRMAPAHFSQQQLGSSVD